MKKTILTITCLLGASMAAQAQLQTSAGIQYLQCMPKDQSGDFSDLSNTYFRLSPRQAFNLNGYWPVRMHTLDFPDTEYDNDPNLSFKIDFVSPRCVRIRMATSPIQAPRSDSESVMLAGPVPATSAWKGVSDGKTIAYKTEYGSIEIQKYPWRIVLKDKHGKVMTQTRHIIDAGETAAFLVYQTRFRQFAQHQSRAGHCSRRTYLRMW